MDSGRHGTDSRNKQDGTPQKNMQPKAFERPAFLHTAGPAQAINMDDIIELAVGTFRCPADLQNKLKNVVTFLDRVVWTTEKHKALGDILQADSSSQELRKQIGDYFCAFGRRNECEHGDETNEAAAVATILAVAGLSPACKILVEKAMLYGVGLGLAQLQQAAADVENGKQLGDRTANTKDLDTVHFMGLLELITVVVCHADCEAGGAVLAIRNLFVIDFSECQRIIDALALERRRWESAYRELGEAPLANFIRMENFKSNLGVCGKFKQTVQEFEFITAHRQEVKMSQIKEWGTVERLFVEAAVTAERKEAHSRDIADDSSIGSDNSDQHLSVGFTGVPKSHHTGRELRPVFGGLKHRSSGDKEEDAYLKTRAQKCEEVSNKMKEIEEEGKDIKITCKNCSTEFTHTVADQVRFASRQWENLPGKCQKCKDNEPAGPCFDFAAGKCGRGDRCKFTHDNEDKLTTHHIAADAEEYTSDSDSDSIDLDCY